MTWEIILRDFWGNILRVLLNKDSKWMNWVASPRSLVNVRLSVLDFCALTLRTVDRSPRSLERLGSRIERCSIG